MIDIHSHILPGIDDGAADAEESIEMAKAAVADGIHTIVATPHTLNGIYLNTLQDITDHVSALRQIFKKEHIPIDLRTGAEVHLCVGMTERIQSGEIAAINDHRSLNLKILKSKIRYVLVEFPTQAIPAGYKNELFQLKASGITPVIAHPERNPVFQRKQEILYEMVSMGCLLQLTAMSITGGLGGGIMSFARQILECRLAHVIATDSHSVESRPPVLSPAVEAAARIMGNMKEAEDMVTKIPEAILEGKSVYIPEPKEPQKKSWFFRVFGGS